LSHGDFGAGSRWLRGKLTVEGFIEKNHFLLMPKKKSYAKVARLVSVAKFPVELGSLETVSKPIKFPYIYDYSNLDKAFGVRSALAVRRLLAP
jgi:hypothetical protein